MRRNICTVVAAAILACTSSSALAQSAVGNPGFEGPILYDVSPPMGNWTAFFGGNPVLDASVSPTAPRTGGSALHLSIIGGFESFCGVQQPITGLQPGVEYTMTIWARRAGNVNNAVEYRYEFRDANNAFIGNQFALNTRIDGQLTDQYQQFQLTAVAPPGTASATLVLAVQTFAFDPLNPVFDTSVYIDDVEFAAAASPNQGACCLSDGTCIVAVNGQCPPGSTSQGPGTTCSPNNCPPPPAVGACCNPATGDCAVTLQTTCVALGGTFLGEASSCDPNNCQAGSNCAADFDNNGTVAVPDIFAFLSDWFAGCP